MWNVLDVLFLVNKISRCTSFQFYWYYDSTCFGQPFCPSSGVLSRTTAVVHFMQLWPFATRSRMERQFHPTPGSKRSQLHKMYHSRCTAKNSWWWAERLPETCRVVISIKLEFSASVGIIHKESVTMHGHTIVKFSAWCVLFCKNRLHFICRIAQRKRTIVYIRIPCGIRTRSYNVRVVRNPVYIRPLGLCGGNILLSADGNLCCVLVVWLAICMDTAHTKECIRKWPGEVMEGHGLLWWPS